jgi:hypothetical protein
LSFISFVQLNSVIFNIVSIMANDTGSSGYKYGSVNTDEESGATGGNKNFDESNLYFIREDELTTRDKVMKAFKLAVPIFFAVLLIGGLAFMLFHNFAYFYPGGGGQQVPSKHSVSSSSGSPTKTTQRSFHDIDAPDVHISAPTTTFASSCAANPKCADLGLIGKCCPAESGIKLECCS